MPIPAPRQFETDAEFIDRCMGDSVMVSEYPENEQRMAVCQSQLDDDAD